MPLLARVVALLLLGLSLEPRPGDARKSKRAKKPRRHTESAAQLMQQGAALGQRQSFEEALALFDRAVQAGGPTLKEARVMRSRTQAMLGRHAEALDGIDAVLQLEPRDRNWYLKGLLLQDLNRKQEAVDAMHTATTILPSDDPERSELLVSLCILMVKHLDAHGCGFGADYAGTAERGSICGRAEQYLQQAMAHCEEAVAIENARPSQDPASRTTKAATHARGRILHALGRPDEARKELEVVADMNAGLRPLADEIALAGTQPWPSQGVLHRVWPVDASGAENLPWSDQPWALRMVSSELGSSPPQFPWFTPIWTAKVSGGEVARTNDLLAQVARVMEAEDPRGATKSNAGGWQSKGVFLESQAEAVRGLRAHILRQLAALLQELQITGTPHVSIGESWANINRKGDWNREHSHEDRWSLTPTTWAGCYYVASGWPEDEGANAKSFTGLDLAEPRLLGDPQRWSSDVLGQAGGLALWPGYLNHSVPEHAGPRDRITIAFNLAVVTR